MLGSLSASARRLAFPAGLPLGRGAISSGPWAAPGRTAVQGLHRPASPAARRHLLGRSLLGRYGIAGEKNAVDIKGTLELVRDGRGQLRKKPGVHIKAALDIVLCVGLGVVVFLLYLHYHNIAGIVVFFRRGPGRAVDGDAPGHKPLALVIARRLLHYLIAHDVDAVADLPNTVLLPFPLV